MSTLVAQTISNGTVSTSTANVINGAKAWANFNGTNGSIRASYNISSVTRTTTGNYTIVMTNALVDTSYAVVITASGESRTQSARIGTIATTGTTTTFSIDIYNAGAGAFQDPAIVQFAVFR